MFPEEVEKVSAGRSAFSPRRPTELVTLCSDDSYPKLAAVGVYAAEPELSRPAACGRQQHRTGAAFMAQHDPPHPSEALERSAVPTVCHDQSYDVCLFTAFPEVNADFPCKVWLSETIDVFHRLHMISGRN